MQVDAVRTGHLCRMRDAGTVSVSVCVCAVVVVVVAGKQKKISANWINGGACIAIEALPSFASRVVVCVAVVCCSYRNKTRKECACPSLIFVSIENSLERNA